MSPDIETSLLQLREKVNDVETTLTSKIADIDKTVAVTKHDVANLKTMLTAFNMRVDKFEDRMGKKIDDLHASLTALNIKQEKGLSFFAGISFAAIVVGGALMQLYKFMFGG